MHMSDALLSPAVGGAMAAVGVAAISYAAKKTAALDDKKIPVMGVMGAFVFAAQMINFTIPGTGSSGHIGGGVLLAAILGPCPALVTLAAVLLIQCLFFADGGLLAYGCNVFNMGVTSCLAYRFLFLPFVRKGISAKTLLPASLVATVAGLQAGAFAVVVETWASGLTQLPFGAFLLAMQPIHLAIGFVEGLVTAAVLSAVYRAEPEILHATAASVRAAGSLKKLIAVFALLALVTGGGLSFFASGLPDGLEWSIEKTAGEEQPESNTPVHAAAGSIVGSTAIMPDYAFPGEESALGTAAAGILGSVITLVCAGGAGFIIHAARGRRGKHAVNNA